MNAAIDKIRHLRFWPRILMFYGALLALAVMYSLDPEGWSGLVMGSLIMGSVVASTFHHYRPYSELWGKLKTSFFLTVNGLVGISIFYICLWGKYLEYGSLVSDEITWIQRIAGIFLAGFGYLIAGIFLGKGRFKPDISVVRGAH